MRPVSSANFKPMQAPRFQSAASVLQPNRFVKTYDFQSLGSSTVPLNKLIYAICILARIIGAFKRRVEGSLNEVFETTLRDVLGWTCWFYATPLLQRLYLLAVEKQNSKKYKDILLMKPKPPANKGFLNWRSAWHKVNILGWHVPEAKQLKERETQILDRLKKQNLAKADLEKMQKAVQGHFKDVIKHRNLASAVGIGFTILFLGVGINLLNMHQTAKRVARRNQLLKNQQIAMKLH